MLIKSRPGQVILLDKIPQFEGCVAEVKILTPQSRTVLSRSLQRIQAEDKAEGDAITDASEIRWLEWTRDVLELSLKGLKGFSEVADEARGVDVVNEVMDMLPGAAPVLAMLILKAHTLTPKEVLS